MINPPYVYGYLTGPPEQSAVFWCQTTVNGKRMYYLIIQSSMEKGGHHNCPNKIAWKNYPGGLSIYNDFDTTLDDFICITDYRKKAKTNKKMTHNAILSEYDGKEELFYCHEGEWLIRQRD
jgi:hypothetical protein